MWRRWGKLVVPLMALHLWPPSPWQLARLQRPMTALVCSVQLAVDFQTRSATLASGNGESTEVNSLESLRKSSIQLCPTSTSMYITYLDLHRFASLGLFSTFTPKGLKRNSQDMSGQVDMMSISYISLNICPSIRFTVETRNRIFGSICTFPRHAVPATRRQVLV